MFLNTLFTISSIKQSEGQVIASIRLNAKHPLYEGHFPGQPVTPGVVQVEIVKEILQKVLDRKLKMKSMKSCKFLQILDPEKTPVIEFNIKYSDDELLDVAASAFYQDVVFFKATPTYW